MMKIFNDKIILFYFFIVILIIFIFFISGFLVGYVLTNKSCLENPFSYGLRQIDNANNRYLNFTCSCYTPSQEATPFSFNKDGIIG